MPRTNPILKDIERHFGFLFARGYRIREKKIPFLAGRNWEVILESPECQIAFYCDQYTVFVVFAPVGAVIDLRLGIGSLVYFLTKGQKFIEKYEGDYRDRKGQLKRLAALVEEYYDMIVPYFEPNRFREHRVELLEAQKAYLELYMRRYVPGF